VTALEVAVGAELFVRTTRFVRLTDTGEHYLLDCRRILRELEEVEARAAGTHLAPQGKLVVAAPIVFGHRLLLPLLVEFLQAYPAVLAWLGRIEALRGFVPMQATAAGLRANG